MKKIETIWHHLLWSALKEKVYRHTQASLATQFGYSTSTIHAALREPTTIGAIRKSGKFFTLADFRKLLYFWATHRQLDKDIIYSTHSQLSTRELESLAIPNSIFAGYSAASRLLNSPPADYTQIFFYINPDQLPQAQTRFPISKIGPSTITFLRSHPNMIYPNSLTTLPHTFVDLWRQSDWYSHDFTHILEKEIHALLS